MAEPQRYQASSALGGWAGGSQEQCKRATMQNAGEGGRREEESEIPSTLLHCALSSRCVLYVAHIIRSSLILVWRLTAVRTFYVAEHFLNAMSAQRRKCRNRSSSGLYLHFLCICPELTFFFTWQIPTAVCSYVIARAEICLLLHPLFFVIYSAVFVLIKNPPPHSSSAPPRKISISQQCMINVILFSLTAVIGFMLHAPLPSGTWSKRTTMFLLFARRLIKKEEEEWCRTFTLSSCFSFPHQVVNAKKKLKKKRYINSGTVSLSSEIRAPPSMHTLVLRCVFIHQ